MSGKLAMSSICALTLALCLMQIMEAKKKVIVTKTVKTTIGDDPNEQHSSQRWKSVHKFDEEEDDGFSRSELFEHHSSSSRKHRKNGGALQHSSSKTVIEHGSDVGFESEAGDEGTTSHTSHKNIVRKKSGKFGKSRSVVNGKRDHGEYEDGSKQYIIRSDIQETETLEGNEGDDEAIKTPTGSKTRSKASEREGETVTQETVENNKASSGAGSSVAVSQTQNVEQSRVAGPCGGNCLQGELVPLYRSFNGALGDHLFTTGIAEHQSVAALGYLSEPDMDRVAKHQEDTGCTCLKPLTRLYNDAIKDHLLVTSDQEKSVVESQLGYKFEGVLGYCVKEIACGASLPLYRFYNGHVKDHHYTVDENEMNLLKSRPGDGYAYEGIECYVWQQGWSPKSCPSLWETISTLP